MPNIALELGKQAASFGVSGIYGEQQDVDGIKIIPVALASSGFGGGSDEGGNGGGGAGGTAIPIGAYIRRGDDLLRRGQGLSCYLWVRCPVCHSLFGSQGQRRNAGRARHL